MAFPPFGTPTLHALGRRVRHAAGLVILGCLGTALAGCGGSSTDAYCGAVKDHQQQLSTVLGAGGEAALLDALPTFRSLRAKAPQDIRDDWDTVIGRLSALRDALAEAGVDPKEYDAAKPPAGVDVGQRQAIAEAATRLGSSETVAALDAVQQQARDVCHTPLSL